ncbi:AfsR/SARP family transcriptional regulator [Streptacidiphilus sp. PAMC 29251]
MTRAVTDPAAVRGKALEVSRDSRALALTSIASRPAGTVGSVGTGGPAGAGAADLGGGQAERTAVTRFSVLGLVSIADQAQTVVFRPSKPVSLLAALLLHPNQTRSVEFLQNAVWEDCPSPTSKATLQTYVLRLRKLFQKFSISDNVIETVPGGYRLPATADSLDLVQFRELVQAARARNTLESELSLLCQALALWQGPPLANIHSGALHRDEVPRLTEEWLRAAERCFDIQIDLGQHGDVTAAVRAATLVHPGHERFREQLIEALYRTGRQADALREYRSVKRYLREELGVYPGAALQRLEAAILRGEELGPRVRPRPPVQTSAAPARPPAEAPRQPLPPDLPHFVGRQRELGVLAEQLTAASSGPMVVVVSGPPGIGKTALAVRLAHLVTPHFPGGQWITRLHGTEQVPRVEPGGQPRSLLLIDNASATEQIERLLPTEPGSAAIVTARSSLVDLVLKRGSRTLRLDALAAPDSLLLLETMLGSGWGAAEPAAADQLAELCGHFPLALRVAATRLLSGTERTTADLVQAIRADPVRKLVTAGDRQVSVHRILAEFLAGLDRQVAEAFVRIGSSPAAEFSLEDCAALAGHPVGRTEQLLESLVDVGLVDVVLIGGGADARYRVNLLLRGFCTAVAGSRAELRSR